MTKEDKINQIVEIRKSIAKLKKLKKQVKGRDNSKRLKKSNMNGWAKECLDNSIWVESRLSILDHYIGLAQDKIEKLKLELEYL